MRWSTFDKMYASVCGKKLEHPVVEVGEWYEFGSVLRIMESNHLKRSNKAV